jgi:DNA (cytosine-5)-methyltransferase 1
LSLFSGSGGLDQGFKQAGFSPVLAIDNNRAAVRTYWHNHVRRDGTLVLREDLSVVTGRDLIRWWKEAWPETPPVGAIGGPPCQAFSLSNVHKNGNDPRARLAFRYADILRALNEEFGLDFFVFENVSGLKSKAHIREFKGLLTAFERAGFNLFEKDMDAQYFGVAQMRPRVIVVGLNSRKYAGRTFEFPVEDREHVLTVRKIIANLPEPVYFRPGMTRAENAFHPNHWTMRPKSNKFRRTATPGTIMGRCFRVLHWDRPSWTVAYGHREVHLHPEGHRRLSMYEAMLLQGFPTTYRLLGTLTDQIRLVSDAVPPPLGEAVARAIRQQLWAEHDAEQLPAPNRFQGIEIE